MDARLDELLDRAAAVREQTLRMLAAADLALRSTDQHIRAAEFLLRHPHIHPADRDRGGGDQTSGPDGPGWPVDPSVRPGTLAG